MNVPRFEARDMSFMYKRNSKGPSAVEVLYIQGITDEMFQSYCFARAPALYSFIYFAFHYTILIALTRLTGDTRRSQRL